MKGFVALVANLSPSGMVKSVDKSVNKHCKPHHCWGAICCSKIRQVKQLSRLWWSVSQLRPSFVQPLDADRLRCAQFLGEKAHAQFFQ